MSKAKDCVADAVFERGLSIMTPDGSEILDPRPVTLPVGFERPESLQETIKRLITDPAIRRELEDAGAESFDEADDLDIEDDVPQSPHEDVFDPMHLLSREQEVMGGAVRPRSPEEVAAAKKVLSDHIAALDAAKAKAEAAVKPVKA